MTSAAGAPPVPRPSPRPRPLAVAGMLDTLAAADRQLADALDGIVLSQARVSRATVSALEQVLATVRPAVDVRTQLARVDRQVLAAAIRLRRERRDTRPRVVETGQPR